MCTSKIAFFIGGNSEKTTKMPYCQLDQSKAHRFTSTNQPEGRGRPKGISILTEIKHILEKKINFEDPETQKRVKGKIAHVIGLRHILNACQGEHNSIVDIIDRIDGKTAQKILGSDGGKVIVIIHNNRDGRKDNRTSILPTQKSTNYKR